MGGAHALTIDGNKPYTELSIGIDNLGIGSFVSSPLGCLEPKLAFDFIEI